MHENMKSKIKLPARIGNYSIGACPHLEKKAKHLDTPTHIPREASTCNKHNTSKIVTTNPTN